MLHFVCDMCGKGLLLDEDVRYEVQIEVKSAYDPLELTTSDFARDFQKEMSHLLEKMRNRSPQELEDEVYKLFKFDLCLTCQKKFLKNPLPKL